MIFLEQIQGDVYPRLLSFLRTKGDRHSLNQVGPHNVKLFIYTCLSRQWENNKNHLVECM